VLDFSESQQCVQSNNYLNEIRLTGYYMALPYKFVWTSLFHNLSDLPGKVGIKENHISLMNPISTYF